MDGPLIGSDVTPGLTSHGQSQMIQKWLLRAASHVKWSKFLQKAVFGDKNSFHFVVVFPLGSEPLGIPAVAPEPHGVVFWAKSGIGGSSSQNWTQELSLIFNCPPSSPRCLWIQLKEKWGRESCLVWVPWHPWLLLNPYLIPNIWVQGKLGPGWTLGRG